MCTSPKLIAPFQIARAIANTFRQSGSDEQVTFGCGHKLQMLRFGANGHANCRDEIRPSCNAHAGFLAKSQVYGATY
jgi:hypothetical protein